MKKTFGNLEVIKDISLSVKEGEVVSIIGPSGSGKSTLLRCATMLEDMDGGTLSYLDQKAAWEEIPIYYHASNVFSTASTTETQGLTVIEAMAAGVPPLCIDDDSFRGTVTDELNGRVFKTQEEYINQVIDFYENKKTIEVYSKQARVQAEHCSSCSYASSVLEVYQRALKEKKEKTGIFTKIANFFKGE